MIAVGSKVIWCGRQGVVQAIGFSTATERQIASVHFGGREVLRLPVDELTAAKEVA